MKKLSLLLFLTSNFTFAQMVSPKVEIVRFPGKNTETVVNIGTSLVDNYKKEIRDGFTTRLTYTIKSGGTTWEIGPSTLYHIMSTSKWEYYKCMDSCIYIEDRYLIKTEGKFDGGIKVSKKGKGNKLFRYNGSLMYPGSMDITEDIGITKKKIERILPSKLRQEFIYSGKSGQTIMFSYREFVDDMARPSFTQNVQYDLSESNIIGFKSLKIEVIKSSNSEIEYKVLSHFND